MISMEVIMLHEEYGLTKVKSFMYAHVIAPIYAYKAMCNTEGYEIPNPENSGFPDVSLNSIQFKKLWTKRAANMNITFTPYRYNADKTVVKKVMSAPYHPKTCFDLWQKGDYKGFISYLDGCYKPKKKKVKESVS